MTRSFALMSARGLLQPDENSLAYSGLMLPAAMILTHLSISRSTWLRKSAVVVPIGWKPSSNSRFWNVSSFTAAAEIF